MFPRPYPSGVAFPRISPNRLQFFEYESITLNCESDGSSVWKVMRDVQEAVPTNISNWVTSAGSSIINPAFSSDSGRYWCENEGGLKSSIINISVTAGSVILESPALPVMEGDSVTLHCTKKKSSAELVAEFYKYRLLLKTGYKGYITIRNVSKSDEGLYRCNLSGEGESPQSWLAIQKHVFEVSKKENQPPQSHSSYLSLLWIIICVYLVALPLLMMGLYHCTRDTAAKDDLKTVAVYSAMSTDQNLTHIKGSFRPPVFQSFKTKWN